MSRKLFLPTIEIQRHELAKAYTTQSNGSARMPAFRSNSRTQQVLREMRERNSPLLLGAYVCLVIVNKRYNGIEIGFCQHIAEHAIVAA